MSTEKISAKILVSWIDYTHLYLQTDFFQWFFPHARIHPLFLCGHLTPRGSGSLSPGDTRTAGTPHSHTIVTAQQPRMLQLCTRVFLFLSDIDWNRHRHKSTVLLSGVREDQFTKACAPKWGFILYNHTAVLSRPSHMTSQLSTSYCISPNSYLSWSQKN